MKRNNIWVGLAVVVVLSLHLAACKDTKTLQENDQLKAQVADLQKQNAQSASDLQTITAARDALTKENETLKAEVKACKTKHPAKKAASRRRRRSQAPQ